MKTLMKSTVAMILGCCMVLLCGCLDEGKERLQPPEMIDPDGAKDDYISYLTDVVGEFRYYGETITGDFLPRGFVGYTFTGKGGEVVSIEVTALSSRRDPVLFLYPPLDPADPWAEIWRTPIAENDDIDYPRNVNAAIRDFTLPYDGVYLVVIAEYRGKGGSFQATLQCAGGGCLATPRICGGIAGFPCPDGKWCKLDGTYPDAAGHCIDTGSCEVSGDCAAQQAEGRLPTDLPCPASGGWAHYECVEGACTPACPEPAPQTRCQRLGGYCTLFTDTCSSGTTPGNEPGQMLGCDGGRSAMCCVPASPNPYACSQNSDCVIVKQDCCGCQMGGSSVAVNRNFEDQAQPDPGLCSDIMCLAVYNCRGTAACVDRLCGIIDADTPEARCIASGGTVGTSSCCMSAGDFPNLCMIGPCGCSPLSSHEIQVCTCPDGQCFDGSACVAR